MGILRIHSDSAIQRTMPEVDVNKLRTLRSEQVLTLKELEEASGVPLNTIWRLESEYRGQTTARQSTIRKLAGALGVEPKELVKNT